MKRPECRGLFAEGRLKLSALLCLKRLKRSSIAPETTPAMRFASSHGFPAPNIFLIPKLMFKEPT